MPKKQPKPKRAKGKPGPAEERLIIKGDPLAAIDKLLKSKPPTR
jgi:hypothetical protein